MRTRIAELRSRDPRTPRHPRWPCRDSLRASGEFLYRSPRNLKNGQKVVRSQRVLLGDCRADSPGQLQISFHTKLEAVTKSRGYGATSDMQRNLVAQPRNLNGTPERRRNSLCHKQLTERLCSRLRAREFQKLRATGRDSRATAARSRPLPGHCERGAACRKGRGCSRSGHQLPGRR